ncbi:unnamed protein product [Cunninghamella blakesleeana]
MSASSGDESMDSLSNDEYESTFSRLFLNDPNTIPSVLLNDLSSPILSPIPNQHQLNQPMKNKNEERHDHYYPPSFFYESYLNHNKNKNKNISNNNNNNNIVSSIPLKKDHGSRSSINSGTTTSSSPSSLTPLSNFKLKNKSYYSKRARIKRHLGFFWRNHYYHHPHHHHSHYESKSLKSNNNSHPKLLKTVSSFPSLKTQHDSSNLTYHPSYDPSLKSSQEKEEFTLLNRTSNELLTQLSNSIQRVQCMIDIEIQSVEDHQKDILFYTNQLEQLDHDIDYLNQKINFMNKESNRDLMIEDLKDWHSSLLQSQQNHHLLLNRFESYYIRSIITKNPLPSLQLKTDLTLKSIHQMNLIRYWSLLIALFLLLCIFIYWFIYYASISLFLMCLLLSMMIIYSFP